MSWMDELERPAPWILSSFSGKFSFSSEKVMPSFQSFQIETRRLDNVKGGKDVNRVNVQFGHKLETDITLLSLLSQ